MKAIYKIYVDGNPNNGTGLFATLKRAKKAAESIAELPIKPFVEILKMKVYSNGEIESEECGEFILSYNGQHLSVHQ